MSFFITEMIKGVMNSTQTIVAMPAKAVKEFIINAPDEVRKTTSTGYVSDKVPYQTGEKEATMVMRETNDVGKEINNLAMKTIANAYVAGRSTAQSAEALQNEVVQGFLNTSQMAIGAVQYPFKALAAGVSDGVDAVRKTAEDAKETANSLETVAWIIGGVAVLGIGAYVFTRGKK